MSIYNIYIFFLLPTLWANLIGKNWNTPLKNVFVVTLVGDSTLSDRWKSVKNVDGKIVDLEHDFQG